MAEFSIVQFDRYFWFDGYRSEHLEDAVAYAQVIRGRGQASRASASLPTRLDIAELPNASDRQLMAQLSITLENGGFVFDEFHYDRHIDAAITLACEEARGRRNLSVGVGGAISLSEPSSRGGRHEMNDAAWRDIVSHYQVPSAKRAIWQLTNTFIPYVLLWCAMYGALQISFWLTIPLAVLAAGFLVRIFIIFHDCAHGSYFKSRRANRVFGFITGVLTFSPYDHWRWEHAIHHRSAGDLDRRGTGDVWTMTVQEYIAASSRRRFAYRLVRHPLILFVIAPFFVFAVKQRFASRKAEGPQRRSVWRMNIALLCMVVMLGQIFGLGWYLLVQSMVLMVAGSAGLWLFYVQHQFEGVYWERGEHWSYTAAALRGSSYYKLPRVLQWLSGNIGFHHIHHLSPRIPNYNLQRCHESNRLFEQVKPITLKASFNSLRFRFWDEQSKRLVGYAFMRERTKQPARRSKAA